MITISLKVLEMNRVIFVRVEISGIWVCIGLNFSLSLSWYSAFPWRKWYSLGPRNRNFFFLRFWPLLIIWSWTSNNLEECSEPDMLQNHILKACCSWSSVHLKYTSSPGHIWLRKFFQIINGPGPYGLGAYDMVLDHRSRPKSPKSIPERSNEYWAISGV